MSGGRWLLFAVVLGVAGYVAVARGNYSWFDVRRAQQDVTDWEADLAELKRQTDSLSARVDSLTNDPGTIETVAREEYGLIRDRELLYRIVPGDSSVTDSVPDAP